MGQTIAKEAPGAVLLKFKMSVNGIIYWELEGPPDEVLAEHKKLCVEFRPNTKPAGSEEG